MGRGFVNSKYYIIIVISIYTVATNKANQMCISIILDPIQTSAMLAMMSIKMSMPLRKMVSLRNSSWSWRRIGVWFIGENPMAGIPTLGLFKYDDDVFYMREHLLGLMSLHTYQNCSD